MWARATAAGSLFFLNNVRPCFAHFTFTVIELMKEKTKEGRF